MAVLGTLSNGEAGSTCRSKINAAIAILNGGGNASIGAIQPCDGLVAADPGSYPLEDIVTVGLSAGVIAFSAISNVFGVHVLISSATTGTGYTRPTDYGSSGFVWYQIL